jgi:hypothetical protein
MKGGFLDNLSNTLSGWGSSLSQGASSMWQKTKNASSSLTGTPSPSPTPSNTQTYQPPVNYGGRRSRHKRGGGIASNASSFSGKTAQPHNFVGGKTRRRRRKTRKH